MLKKLIVAAAAVTLSQTANAVPKYYDFEWKGFNEVEHQPDWSPGEPEISWNPDARIRGYFKADDLNGDNIISRNELERFGIHFGVRDTAELIGCPQRGMSTIGYTGCNIDMFSYTIGGELTFTASSEFSANASVYSYYFWDLPADGYLHSANDICCGDFELKPTADTRFTIAASVPEPSAWAMLGAGLLIGTAAVRRRAARG